MMKRWIINRLRLLASLCLGAVVLALLIVGVQHGRLRQGQLKLARGLSRKTKTKILEVQNAQYNAAISVRSGRDELAGRMRSGQF